MCGAWSRVVGTAQGRGWRAMTPRCPQPGGDGDAGSWRESAKDVVWPHRVAKRRR